MGVSWYHIHAAGAFCSNVISPCVVCQCQTNRVLFLGQHERPQKPPTLSLLLGEGCIVADVLNISKLDTIFSKVSAFVVSLTFFMEAGVVLKLLLNPELKLELKSGRNPTHSIKASTEKKLFNTFVYYLSLNAFEF